MSASIRRRPLNYSSPSQDIIEPRIKFYLILLHILVELLGAQNLGNSYQLVIVVVAVEERLLAEYHTCQHTSQRPHVK